MQVADVHDSWKRLADCSKEVEGTSSGFYRIGWNLIISELSGHVGNNLFGLQVQLHKLRLGPKILFRPEFKLRLGSSSNS